MNVIAAVKSYILKMTEESGPGMKVLLMDKQTTSIVSMVYSQSEIMQKEVYLFERIDSGKQHDPMKYMKCIAFLRPTKENISLLQCELKNPRYGSYYIYLSNITSKEDIKNLADSDEQEVVREIQEFYADYLVFGPHLFSLGMTKVLKGLTWNPNYLQRCAQGITAVLLSLKKRPMIRYQKSSSVAKRLADAVKDTLCREHALFDFRQTDVPPVLLILDRRDDVVTPLLNQWTYQAMVHELLTINNNRVMLTSDNTSSTGKEVLLSPEQDEFYCNNLYLNFGEIAETIKELMEDFQKKAKNQQKVESIADMKNFLETYPQFQKMSGAVTKHVSVVSELSNLVAKYNLLDVSELEQELACQDDHSQQLQRVRKTINDSKVRELDAVRIVMLYSLRYKTHSNNDITGLIDTLSRRGVAQRLTDIIPMVLEYGNENIRQSDLFGSESTTTERIKKRLYDFKGCDNIFTRHKPALKLILENLMKGRLNEVLYPTLDSGTLDKSVQQIIVFQVGGTTYEESLAVHQLNRNDNGYRIVLGGTTIHNTTSFLDEVETATEGVPRTFRRTKRL